MNTNNHFLLNLINKQFALIFEKQPSAKPDHPLSGKNKLAGFAFLAALENGYIREDFSSLVKHIAPNCEPRDILAAAYFPCWQFYENAPVFQLPTNIEYTRRHLEGVAGAFEELHKALNSLKNWESEQCKSKHDANHKFIRVVAYYGEILGMTPRFGGVE